MTKVDNIFHCDQCRQPLMDLLLWIEVNGTYKVEQIDRNGEPKWIYKTFRWDFCDPYCLKDYMNKLDMDKIGKSKLKEAIEPRKKKSLSKEE